MFVESDIFEIKIFIVFVNNCSICVLQIYLNCTKDFKRAFEIKSYLWKGISRNKKLLRKKLSYERLSKYSTL
jgi:hypothetical protein